MEITIHRGKQIGGCITEIRSGCNKIIIDLGSNLPGTSKPDFDISEVRKLVSGADAILYTHYHEDHIGHFSEVDNIPQYIGEGALEVMICKLSALQAASERNAENGNAEEAKQLNQESGLMAISKMMTYEVNKPLRFGNITVTPYVCSHSAFDAYMFKIEADGKKVLHTGDFRDHGYLGKGLSQFIPKFVGQVDVIVTEGTMLSRANESAPHEAEIKAGAKRLLGGRFNRKHLFALCSSTDIDRLASFHSACKEKGAWLVVDHYQKSILDIFTKYSGKKSELYVFDRIKVLDKDERFFNEIQTDGFIMPIRSSMSKLIGKILCYFPDAELIYSMWNGYYKGTPDQINPYIKEIVGMFSEGRFHTLHTSGHATIQALSSVIRMTQPKSAIIPIHMNSGSDLSLLDIPDNLKSKIIEFSREVDGIEIEIL